MANRRLAIHPAPFKPSLLSIPPSPFSPLSPLTSTLPPQKRPQSSSHRSATPSIHSVPTTPLKWAWTCHACHNAYPLGATRRCLDDGHYFCAGTTVTKNWRKGSLSKRTKRHRACASEYDYLGWKAWGRWKRSFLKSDNANAAAEQSHTSKDTSKTAEKTKNCWTHCDYPSQCRWGREVGIHTPTPTATSFSFDIHAINTSLLNSAMQLPSLDECFATSPPPSYEAASSRRALGDVLGASAFGESVGNVLPLITEFLQTSTVSDVDMVDAEDAGRLFPTCSTVGERCIDPALLVSSGGSSSCTSMSSVSAQAVGLEKAGNSRPVDESRSSLSLPSPRPSRRHIDLLPVSSAQRRLRRRRTFSALTIQKPDGPSFEGCLPLESVPLGGWKENALNVV